MTHLDDGLERKESVDGYTQRRPLLGSSCVFFLYQVYLTPKLWSHELETRQDYVRIEIVNVDDAIER